MTWVRDALELLTAALTLIVVVRHELRHRRHEHTVNEHLQAIRAKLNLNGTHKEPL